MHRLSAKILLRDFEGKEIQNILLDFKYKFDEEKDDECTFTIKSPNENLPDDPRLQEGKLLTVSWGWFDGNFIANTRRIYIFDISVEYGEDGVVMTFICHEKFALSKMDSVANKNLNQLKSGVPILFSSTAMDAVNMSVENGSTQLEKLLKKPTEKELGLAKSTIEAGTTLVSYYNGNLSTFRGLRMYLDRLPGGPYVIDSRDDAVTVRTRDFTQDSLRTFHYKKGNVNGLLMFKPESKNRSKAGQSVPACGLYLVAVEYPYIKA